MVVDEEDAFAEETKPEDVNISNLTRPRLGSTGINDESRSMLGNGIQTEKIEHLLAEEKPEEFSRKGFLEIFLGSKLNLLLLLTPFAAIANNNEWGDGFVFVLSLLAIAPFAERLGFVTEQLAMHTNDTLGGLLNATFGNATELIISLFALLKGRSNGHGDEDHPELYLSVVRVSLLGSIISNLLLVLGSALLIGGLRHKEQYFNKKGTAVNIALLISVCLVVSAPIAIDSGESNKNANVLGFSRIASVLLCIVYALFLVFQLKTHGYVYEEDCSPPSSNASLGIDEEKGHVFADEDDEDEEELVLGFWTAITWLGVISVFISFLSEFLVSAIEGTTRIWQVPEEFIGAILLPVVGNAAEHASAVVFAYRNKMDIALGIALGSAAQIGVSVLPACVLLGWGIESPLDLSYEAFEASSLIFSVLLVWVVLRDGLSFWLHGVVLVTSYMILATGFWYHE